MKNIQTKRLTVGEFFERFTPIKHPEPNEDEWGQYFFCTYDPDIGFIEGLDPAHVWTAIRNTDDYSLIIASGKILTNRVHYLVCLEPVPEGVYFGFKPDRKPPCYPTRKV